MLILLYGHLGKEFGRVHRYAVKSPAEAVRAMCATIPNFAQKVRNGGAYRVLVGGRDPVHKETLHYPNSEKETIRILPVISGAGRGLGQIILGAALIGLSFAIPTFTPAIDLALSTGISVGTMASSVSSIGVSLLVGGVAQMLFKPPSAQSVEAVNNRPSFTFDGALNTVAQGNPVPVCYGGPIIVGSQVISSGLTVEQIA